VTRFPAPSRPTQAARDEERAAREGKSLPDGDAVWRKVEPSGVER